ncbi:hypothetical protein ABT009_38430 [Streptomyces sp. NPDC002896]|uniref:hypothetical protein n=1 Tax=Streptomyces sp. NPDC002896 TaxID=3154438 RepID=UPI00333378E2
MFEVVLALFRVAGQRGAGRLGSAVSPCWWRVVLVASLTVPEVYADAAGGMSGLRVPTFTSVQGWELLLVC